MEKLQVLFVAMTGVAAAVPGMATLRKLDFPGESEVLFEFVLAAFSAAIVLLIYALRDIIRRRSRWQVLMISCVCLSLVLVFFLGYIQLTNRVMVPHTWRGELQQEFVPLFLSDEADAKIRKHGSRSAWINENGPDDVAPYTTETNVGTTLVVLLLVYTFLVGSLSGAFCLLGLQALVAEEVENSPDDA